MAVVHPCSREALEGALDASGLGLIEAVLVGPVVRIRELATRVGGHATLFRGGDKAGGVFTPLQPALMEVHRRLKQSFDPYGVFNPGRMYPEL